MKISDICDVEKIKTIVRLALYAPKDFLFIPEEERVAKEISNLEVKLTIDWKMIEELSNQYGNRKDFIEALKFKENELIIAYK